jgi:hypothetical protein
VHRENEERKVIITELTRGGSGLGLEGRTAVMNDEVRNRETGEHMGIMACFRSQHYLFSFHHSLSGHKMFPLAMQPSAESLTHRSLEHSALFQQAGLGQASVTDSRAAAAALFTQRSLNPFGGG